MFLDTVTYLPDDLLVKVDRASMAVSLEARVPLLDHRVFEFASCLSLHIGLNGKGRKRILRRGLARYVPRKLFERPKEGFSVPLRQWLLGPLRPLGRGPPFRVGFKLEVLPQPVAHPPQMGRGDSWGWQLGAPYLERTHVSGMV